MRRLARLAVAFGPSLVLAVVGCRNEVTLGSSGAGGSAAATSSSSSAGPSTTGSASSDASSGSGGSIGDCTTNDDCEGAPCVPIVPGGYRVCAALPPEATSCDPAHIDDQCCSSADCAKRGGGRCYLSSDFPFCGGAVPPLHNLCAHDGCTNDADCFGGTTGQAACVPPGVTGFPMASCLMTFCRQDADCKAAPGGYCAPVVDPCCGLLAGLACIYPGGCRSNLDCESGGCVLDTAKGVGRCDPNGIQCPASQ